MEEVVSEATTFAVLNLEVLAKLFLRTVYLQVVEDIVGHWLIARLYSSTQQRRALIVHILQDKVGAKVSRHAQ